MSAGAGGMGEEEIALFRGLHKNHSAPDCWGCKILATLDSLKSAMEKERLAQEDDFNRSTLHWADRVKVAGQSVIIEGKRIATFSRTTAAQECAQNLVDALATVDLFRLAAERSRDA